MMSSTKEKLVLIPKSGYTKWDLQGTRRKRIGADCLRVYTQSGEHQYRMAAARIAELEAKIQLAKESLAMNVNDGTVSKYQLCEMAQKALGEDDAS